VPTRSLSDKLNRLTIGSPCESSWDEMQGEGGRRFCAQCQRQVFDFAEMTPREIGRHLQASRGRLCGRLTRRAGRLVTARSPAPPDPAGPFDSTASCARRRASAIAATLVSAWLSAAAAEAQPAESSAPEVVEPREEAEREEAPNSPAAATPSATLRGRVTGEDGLPVAGVEIVITNGLDGRQHRATTGVDGGFVFEALPAGIYDLEGTLEDFWIGSRSSLLVQPGEVRQADLDAVAGIEEITVGGMRIAREPLRQAFEESDLVAVAVAGASTVLEHDDEMAEVATELRIESLFKGGVSGRTVTYRHSEYLEPDETTEEGFRHLAPGTRVLAFLEPREEGAGPRGVPTFESTYSAFGVQHLTEPERAAYLDRLEALVRMERRAERRGGMDLDELMEWLVATVEDPYTREEATDELFPAIEALRHLAARQGIAPEVAAQDLLAVVDRFLGEGGTLSEKPRAEVLGASLTQDHRRRLTAALRSTAGLGDADLLLFAHVRTWDEAAATAWLVRELRATRPRLEDADAVWDLAYVAQQLGNESLTELVEATAARMDEIYRLWPRNESEETDRLRQEKLDALYHDLYADFAAALAGSH
jgi:Carboxypeptidase regulatory-like domain